MLRLDLVLLSGLVLAFAAPLLNRALGPRAAWVHALFPAAALAGAIALLPVVSAGPVTLLDLAWVPSLGIRLRFAADGWSVLFALLIAGFGLLVQLYARDYFDEDPRLPRFQLGFVLFQVAMLGLVFSDDLVALFVFWELTSISSWLLIGLDRDDPVARRGALHALLVTGGGGLALLAGLILLGDAAGTTSLTALADRHDALVAHPAYAAILPLVLLGAFTKSAQFPFHFWLPGAMAAPTPVSAYLHAATMVKAGVYLLGRLAPALGGTPAWQAALSSAGAVTFVWGLGLALRERDLKAMLAGTTVSALGSFVLLLGADTPAAHAALVVLIAAHALYKGAMFLTAGAIDSAAGTRDLGALSGLGRALPALAAVSFVAALGVATLPPGPAWRAKELAAAALGQATFLPQLLPWVLTLGGLAAIPVAVRLWARPFLGASAPSAGEAASRGVPGLMLLAIGVPAALQALWALFPGDAARLLFLPAARAIAPTASPALAAAAFELPAVGLKTALSALVWAAGLALAWRAPGFAHDRLPPAPMHPDAPRGLAAAFDSLLRTTLVFAERLTARHTSGRLPRDLRLVLLATLALLVWGAAHLERPPALLPAFAASLDAVDLGVLALLGAGLACTLVTRSRYVALITLGLIGYAVALLFTAYGAPDLALTQFLVETLSLILLLFAARRIPDAPRPRPDARTLGDAALSLGLGAAFTAMLLVAHALPHGSSLREAFGARSWLEAHGRNVVNVILVDFRGLDTLGEITVLAIAAAGVYALLRAFPRGGRA